LEINQFYKHHQLLIRARLLVSLILIKIKIILNRLMEKKLLKKIEKLQKRIKIKYTMIIWKAITKVKRPIDT